MPSLVLVVPGSLESLTGGYGYDRRMVAGLRSRGWSIDVREIDGSFPHPTAAARAHAARALAEIPAGKAVLVDGLALGALPDEMAREASRLRLVAVIHHPLAAETGLDPVTATALEQSERRALAAVRLTIVTSRATAGALAGYGVDRHQVVVVEPGTDRASLSAGSPGPFLQLLCVATLIPRKGHEILFQALAAIPERGWRLACVGSTSRHAQTTERLCESLAARGLADRVELTGEMDGADLAARYNGADVFVLSTLHEGYGMAVAEALSHGLPVISTAVGAIPDLVGDEAGVVVPPGDVPALTAALAAVVGDARVRARLRRGAEAVRDRLPTWEEASAAMEAVLLGLPVEP